MNEENIIEPVPETAESINEETGGNTSTEGHEHHHHHHHHSEDGSSGGEHSGSESSGKHHHSEHHHSGTESESEHHSGHHHSHSEHHHSSDKKTSSKKHKKKKKKDDKKGIVARLKKMNKTGKQAFLFITGILVCAIVIIGISHIGNRIAGKRDGENHEKYGYDGVSSGEVFIDGESYIPKKNISSFLIIGIDKSGRFKEVDSYINNQQCDFLALVVFDSDAKTYRVIHINRDTMTPVNMLGVRGEVVSTRMMQIALAHTYGNGLDRSCENTLEAVSNLMYGINVEKYFAVTMSGVSALADYVGGVPVTVEEDLTVIDPSFTEGAEVVLKGEMALKFVRARQSVSDGTNISRMGRQKQFISSLMEIFEAEEDTEGFIYGAMKKMSDYSITNIEANDIEDIAESFDEYSFDGLVSPEGEAVFDGEYMRFNIDDEKLKKLVLDTFYDKVAEN